MVEQQLTNLFHQYLAAFEQYDLKALHHCYHLPCTLHTPDKIAFLKDEEHFNQEIADIFLLLKNANIKRIKMLKASYSLISKHSINVCVDWAFIDDNDNVFADFTAFYQLECIEQQYKIINVVSHDLTNSITLDKDLKI